VYTQADLLGIEKDAAKVAHWSPETAVEVETFYGCFNSRLG
jgi:hypothetical protein